MFATHEFVTTLMSTVVSSMFCVMNRDVCSVSTESQFWNDQVEVEVEVNLRPTVSRPIYLGVGLPSGAHDQIFVFCLTIAGFLMCGTLSDERMGL
jgi:hypothetical protein